MGLLNSYFEKDEFYLGKAVWWKQLIFNIGVSLSQLLNTVIGGDPDETISARCGRCQLDPKAPKWAKTTANFVDWVFGPGHCINAVEHTLSRQKEIWHISSTKKYPKPAKIHRGF